VDRFISDSFDITPTPPTHRKFSEGQQQTEEHPRKTGVVNGDKFVSVAYQFISINIRIHFRGRADSFPSTFGFISIAMLIRFRRCQLRFHSFFSFPAVAIEVLPCPSARRIQMTAPSPGPVSVPVFMLPSVM
jgi:hypothetical protein